MKFKDIRAKLSKLGRELEDTENIEIDARREMQELHRQVDLLERDDRSEVEFLFDRLKRLESRFAAEHPTLERIARDVADSLAKMGV